LLRCSHIVCKVDDIRTAVSDFETLGFQVEWGSSPERAHNALIWFEQGPFLEFFELPRWTALLRWPFSFVYGRAAGDRLVRWASAKEGWCDLALEIDDTELAATHSTLREAGLKISKVIKGRRTRPDGRLVHYQFLTTRPANLPFVVSAYDPPQRPARIAHPNGARAIARVRIGVSEMDRAYFDLLVGHDKWITPVTSAQTGVLAVELEGLNHILNLAQLHGAVLNPAMQSKSQTAAQVDR
jgi:Glyoxalase-like domain